VRACAISVELRAKDGDDGMVEFGGMGVLVNWVDFSIYVSFKKAGRE
jgi:hypothetical protein